MTPASTGSAASFEPLTMAADARRLQQILTCFFDALPHNVNWNRHTEWGGKGWTFRQVLAHITAVGETMYMLTDATLTGRPTHPVVGLQTRTDLPHYNEQEIAARMHATPQVLMHTLLCTLDRLAYCCLWLTPDDLARQVPIAAYNSPLTIAHLIGSQLIHPGLVHAAQLAIGTRTQPLWRHYTPEMMNRQLTRAFSLLPYVYWPERGGNINATVTYTVGGAGGGVWTFTLRPDGATAQEGAVARPSLRLWFASPDALCRVLTFYTPVPWALMRGEAFIWGNMRLGMKLPSLFSPT